MLTWFGNLDGSTQTIILGILALVAAISPVLGLISTLTGLAAGLNVAMLPMIGTIALIVAGIAAAIAIGVLLYQNWDTIKAKASELWTSIKEAFTNMLNSVTETMNGIKEAIINGWNEAINFITELPSKAYNWGADIIGQMIKGITDNPITNAISGVADTIAKYIHFSEPDVGPLKNFHTFMPDMMEQMAKGIEGNTWRVEQAISGTATVMANDTKADYSPITGRLDSLIGATAGQTVNVVLQGDAAGLFKAVRQQNNIFTKATGRGAF